MHDLQVLDEIHRQPVSLSLSMVSLPAPESVVDSFPLKCHKKVKTSEGSEDIEQYVPDQLTLCMAYRCFYLFISMACALLI